MTVIDWNQEIRIRCENCGGLDICFLDGRFKSKHECEGLNTNQILLRIARALESKNCLYCEKSNPVDNPVDNTPKHAQNSVDN